MAEKRCEITELPVEMCSHCRGLDDKPRPQVTVKSISIARFNGRCGVCGEHGIREDGPLYRVEVDGEELWAGPCCGDV